MKGSCSAIQCDVLFTPSFWESFSRSATSSGISGINPVGLVTDALD